MSDRSNTVLQHFLTFFEGHETKILSWDLGPIKDIIPEFKILCVEPGPKSDLWSYCSIGASSLWSNDSGLMEFIVHSPISSPRLVETMAMITSYHRNHKLGFGHTLPIGEPWLDGSICDHWLVSKPYPLGPDLEICNLESTHIHVGWLLPVTENEKNYKADNGLEKLEQLFEDKGLEYWEINRASLV